MGLGVGLQMGTNPFVSHHDEQVFSPRCKATRRWVTLATEPSLAATRKINQWIEKQVTVGKKLKASDCPDASSSEIYEYSNELAVSGSVGGLAGLSLVVYFPGGSGRVARKCVVVGYGTGNRFSLNRYLTSAGRALLAKTFCQGALKASDSGADPKYFCSSAQKDSAVGDGLFCLKDEGIEVSVPHNGNFAMMAQSQLVAWTEVQKYFRFPDALKDLKEHR